MRNWQAIFFISVILAAETFFSTSVLADDTRVNPGLVVRGEEMDIPLPLVKTSVDGVVEGIVARVTVRQTFVNPYDGFIEATYVFPLPETAAVNGMVMNLSNRVVVAEIKERKEANRIYEEARAAGKTTALLDQERPNVFTQKVGNIPPGEIVEVELTYVELLSYDEGLSSFVFPMVVGPRYIPGKPLSRESLSSVGRELDSRDVPDASRITPPSFGEGATGAHAIDLTLRLRPGFKIKSVQSTSHRIHVKRIGEKQAVVTIDKTDSIPNKDFILTTDLRGKDPELALLTHREGNEPGYVTVVVQPPSFPKPEDVSAKDLFFVVDNSGSMHGAPLNAAKALIIEALKNMNPRDRFTIMRFSDEVSALSETPLKNTFENVARGIAFTREMEGMGGTEMLSGVRRALEGTSEPGRVRIVFFLTDGYIGNDDQIIAEVKDRNTAGARLFALGVGSSVNRYLLSSMARLGRGELQVMGYDEDPAPFVKRFYKRVRNPVLSDVELSFEGLGVTQQTPALVPDLFDGQPLVVHARYKEPGRGKLRLRGRLGSRAYDKTVPIELPEFAKRPAVANIFARALIGQWNDEELSRPGSRKDEILELALSHNLMSKYTSFVAVDKSIARAQGDPLIPIAQRIPLPDGVSSRALGSLSRYEIPPGDPFISVKAPEGTVAVTVLFPFGLVKSLSFDAGRGLWRGRFLVPAGIPDGHYEVTIAISGRDGKFAIRKETYHLDSSAAEFLTNFEEVRVRAGRGFLLEVDTIENADEVYAHGDGLGILRKTLVAKTEKCVHWFRFIKVDVDTPPGDYTLLVVVRDGAGNRLEKDLLITVYGE